MFSLLRFAWFSHCVALRSFHVFTAHSPFFQVSHPSWNLIRVFPLCSLCRLRGSSSVLLSSPRSAVLRSLTFSWHPGMTCLRFASVSEQTVVDYPESAFGVRDIWRAHARKHTRRLCANTLCVTHSDEIKTRLHAREWSREQAWPLQKEVSLVWNIDVLWDLRGVMHEIYKLLLPVSVFTFCCEVLLFSFKAMSENKRK